MLLRVSWLMVNGYLADEHCFSKLAFGVLGILGVVVLGYSGKGSRWFSDTGG
jgi:hypothetical protein